MAGEQSVLIMQSPRNLLTSMSLLIGLALAAVVLNSSLRNHAWSHKNVLFGNGVNLRGDSSRQQSLAMMGTGLPVFTGLQNAPSPPRAPRAVSQVTRGRATIKGQAIFKLGENDVAHDDWDAAGLRGSALGSIAAPQIDHFVEEAAADCGSDPNCFCDWAKTPRSCLFDYCCGTITHGLGQTRGDYTSSSPTGAQLVDAYQQQKHLETWQRICQPEQTYFAHKCSSEAVPEHDNRKH